MPEDTPRGLTIPKELNPHNTMCIVKHGETVVGRIPATAANAESRIVQLGKQYGGQTTVDFVEDENASLIASLSSPLPRF